MAYITEKTLIGEIVNTYPESIETLLSVGMHCCQQRHHRRARINRRKQKRPLKSNRIQRASCFVHRMRFDLKWQVLYTIFI